MTRRNFFELENNLLGHRNKIAEYTKKKYLHSAFVSIGIGIVILVIGIFFPDLFKDYYVRHE